MAAATQYVKVGQDLQYAKGFAITPSDTVDFEFFTQAIYCSVTGNAVVVWEDGTTSTLTGLLAGHIYRVKLRRMNAATTGTYVGLL